MSEKDNNNADGPIIRWDDYGTEGWKPQSFPSIRAALEADRYGSRWVITRPVSYEVNETS